tara:strand:+ start:2347 stop:3105 length:759 start_codon:yes stop_codon:yes gene_type:complete
MVEIIILSLVQGITEFLPVSSSSHLILFSNYLDFQSKSLSIDVSLHIGSFLAVITYFRNEVKNFIRNKKLFLKIFLSSVPVMFFGYILVKFNLINHLRNIEVIGWTTIIFGIILYFSDKCSNLKKLNNHFNLKSALLIGFFQILSLVPGVSRSGIAISVARILKFDRYDASKLSFLISIPILLAVSLFGINNLIFSQDINFSILNIMSIFLSYLFSFLTIKYFLQYIKRFSLNAFVIYRIILGVILLSIVYL